MATLSYTGTLVTKTCWCGIHHAVPEDLHNYQQRQHDEGRTVTGIYCPLGHSYVPAGEGKAAKLKQKLEWERDRSARLVADLDQSEARRIAQKAATTRAKKRHAAALCPVCNRSFKQLRQHMERKHPDYEAEEPTTQPSER